MKKPSKQIAALLTAVLLCFGTVRAALVFADNTDAQIPVDIYVSKDGSDENGDGTKEKPYATLGTASEKVKNTTVIHILTDLDMSEMANLHFGGKEKSVTVIGEKADGTVPVISRADDFKTHSDRRSWYNPAMIEFEGKLLLENVVFNDNNKTEGEYFIQEKNDDIPDGTSIVQDAVIASYDGTGNLTLGSGAEIRNFGGMSAVRITGKSGSLTMLAGSKIAGGGDNAALAVVKDEKGKNKTVAGSGAQGAVWLQNGSFVMENGAEISGINGRAVYADMGSVTVNGTISDIKYNKNYINAAQGTTVHIRGGANADIGGTVTEINNEGGNNISALHAVDKGILNISGTVSHVNKGLVINAEGAGVKVNVSGTVENIAGNVLNLIKAAEGTLKSGAIIRNIENAGNMIWVSDGSGEPGVGDGIPAKFTMESGAIISNVKCNNLINAQVDGSSQTAIGKRTVKDKDGKNTVKEVSPENCDRIVLNINGEISGVTVSGDYNKIIYCNSSIDAKKPEGNVLGGYIECTIGASADIYNNTVSSRRSAIFGGQGGTFNIYGKIHNNSASVAFTMHNCGPADIHFYDGAEIYGNTSPWLNDVFEVRFGRLTFHKGSKVYNNKSGLLGKAVITLFEGSQLVMDGGEIYENSAPGGYAVSYTGDSYWGANSNVLFKSGRISNSGKLQIASGGNQVFTPSSDGNTMPGERCFTVPDKEVSDVTDVYFAEDSKTVTANGGTKLGNVYKDIKSNSLAEAVKEYGCKTPFATLWAQNKNGTDIKIAFKAANKFDAEKPIYAILIETDNNGNATDNVKLISASLADGAVSFTLPKNDYGYAAAITQPDDLNGTLSVTADKSEIASDESEKEINYDLSFEFSENGIKPENVETATVTVFSSSEKIKEETVDLTKSSIYSFTYKINDFKDGTDIDTYAVLTVKAKSGETYTVISNTARTAMKNAYVLNYNLNGGTGDIESERRVGGSDFTVTDKIPVRDDCEFIGWALDADAEEAEYKADMSITIDEGNSVTLYALWKQNLHTVTVNYVYIDGTEASKPYIGSFTAGSEYSVKSPVLNNFTVSDEVISGVMGKEDIIHTP